MAHNLHEWGNIKCGGATLVNVIVVFPKIDDAKKIRNLLVRNGIDVTAVCNSGAQVFQFIDAIEDGIIVSGYRMADMQCTELRDNLSEDFQMLILASQGHVQEFAGDDIVCLPMPIKAYDLVNTIEDMYNIIMRRRKKRREKPKQRSAEEKAVIENAKMRLMREKNFTEEEAHRYLQKISMDSGRALVETCQMLISMV